MTDETRLTRELFRFKLTMHVLRVVDKITSSSNEKTFRDPDLGERITRFTGR